MKALLCVWKWMSSPGVLVHRVHIMGQQEMHPQGLENASYFWLAVTVPVCSGLTFASILTKQQSLLF